MFCQLCENENEVDFEGVVEFIIKNCEDQEKMDKINKMTFPFTSKFDVFTKNQLK